MPPTARHSGVRRINRSSFNAAAIGVNTVHACVTDDEHLTSAEYLVFRMTESVRNDFHTQNGTETAFEEQLVLGHLVDDVLEANVSNDVSPEVIGNQPASRYLPPSCQLSPAWRGLPLPARQRPV